MRNILLGSSSGAVCDNHAHSVLLCDWLPGEWSSQRWFHQFLLVCQRRTPAHSLAACLASCSKARGTSQCQQEKGVHMFPPFPFCSHRQRTGEWGKGLPSSASSTLPLHPWKCHPTLPCLPSYASEFRHTRESGYSWSCCECAFTNLSSWTSLYWTSVVKSIPLWWK